MRITDTAILSFSKVTGLFLHFLCVGNVLYYFDHGTLLRKSLAHKSFIQRENNASWLISYFDVGYCYRLYVLSTFSNRHAVLRKLLVWQEKRKFGTVVKISSTKNVEIMKNVKI